MKTIRWGIRLNQKSKIKDENVHIFLTASGRVVKPSGQPDRFFTVFFTPSLILSTWVVPLPALVGNDRLVMGGGGAAPTANIFDLQEKEAFDQLDHPRTN